MTARSMMLLVVATAIAAIVAGCGGGGDEATTVTTSSLSKPAFVKEAEAVCEKARGKIIASSQTLPEGISSTIVPALEGMVGEIRELGAPSGDEREVEAFLETMQQESEALTEKQASISSFPEVEEEFKTSGGLAQKYGMPKCAFYARFTSS